MYRCLPASATGACPPRRQVLARLGQAQGCRDRLRRRQHDKGGVEFHLGQEGGQIRMDAGLRVCFPDRLEGGGFRPVPFAVGDHIHTCLGFERFQQAVIAVRIEVARVDAQADYSGFERGFHSGHIHHLLRAGGVCWSGGFTEISPVSTAVPSVPLKGSRGAGKHGTQAVAGDRDGTAWKS